MEIISGVFGVLLVALFIFQLYVLFRIVTASFYTGAQKLVQFLLVILIPILGAFLAWGIWRSMYQEIASSDPHFEPNRNDGDVAFLKRSIDD